MFEIGPERSITKDAIRITVEVVIVCKKACLQQHVNYQNASHNHDDVEQVLATQDDAELAEVKRYHLHKRSLSRSLPCRPLN